MSTMSFIIASLTIFLSPISKSPQQWEGHIESPAELRISRRSDAVRQHTRFELLLFHQRLQRKGFERIEHFPGYFGPDVPHKALLGALTEQRLFSAFDQAHRSFQHEQDIFQGDV